MLYKAYNGDSIKIWWTFVKIKVDISLFLDPVPQL